MVYTREEWQSGDTAHFEYHCYEGRDSSDAEAWYRSHQVVTVLRRVETNETYADSFSDRAEEGAPYVYTVQWADGFVYDVWEDELLVSADGYYRPAPPAR